MPADKEPLIGLDEIARTLETYEGPEGPRTRPPAPPKHVLRWTWSIAAGALVVGSSVGFGLGTSLTPSGNAAGTPAGLGFVPASGWTVLQSGGDASPARAAFAIASSVPLHAEDDARGIRTSSGLPYATLLDLPRDGIVIAATFTIPIELVTRPYDFPERKLPLRLRDATPFVANATQIRPDRPLGEYELRAQVDGRDVSLHFYFGRRVPTAAMLRAAQRQLDQLVVEPNRRARASLEAAVDERALPLRPASSMVAAAAVRVVDRTLVCTPGVGNGIRNVNLLVKSAPPKGTQDRWLAQAVVATPGNPLPSSPNQYMPQLVGVTAGWPPPPLLKSGGAGFHAKLCKASRAVVPLSARKLAVGGPASVFGEDVRCPTPKTVLVRIRAEFFEPTELRLISRKTYYSAEARIRRAQIAVRTTAGKPIAYADVTDAGKARLFTAGSCI